jgi:hypothetical protein
MKMSASAKPGSVAQVDRVVAEQGHTVDVPDDTSLKVATDVEQAVGGTGPTAWWAYGLVGLLIVAVILLALQFLNGNQSTDVVPGTPIAAPGPVTNQG